MKEKELLQQLVKECSSLSTILKRQGKAVSGASMKILKEKLDTYNIPYHFIHVVEGGRKEKKPTKDILVKNSQYKAQALKKRLIEEGYKKDVCEICGQLPE